MYDYDMVVIGSGPSGRRAAVQFAKLGKSVLVVEKGRRVGGVSVGGLSLIARPSPRADLSRRSAPGAWA